MVVYSHSRIGAFDNCPYQYKLRYVEKVVPLLGNTIESYMGGIVHEALEWLYDTVINHDTATKKEVLEYFDKRWTSKWKEDIRVIKSEFDFEHYKVIGEECIEKYYDRYKPFNQSITMGLEKRLFLDLPEGKRMVGLIDRLDKKSDIHFEVHDYKTSNRLMLQEQADIDRQLSLYAIAVHQNYPEVEKVDLIWHFVKFDEEVRSTREQTQLSNLALETTKKINIIENAVSKDDFPTSKSMLCEWCDYKKQCPEFGNPILSEKISSVVDNLVSVIQSSIPDEDKMVIKTTMEDKIKLFSQQSGEKDIEGSTHRALIQDTFERIPPKEGDLNWFGLKSALEGMNVEIGDFSNVFHTPKLSEEQKDSVKGYFEINRGIKVILEKI